jgi:glyoxylase I family protein
MARAVQHIAINCRDKDAQEAFYAEHFGFRRARVFKEGEPDEFVMLRLGDTCMELFQSQAGPEARGGEQPVGFKHLCFDVADIEAKAAELEGAGVPTEGIIDCGHQVPGLKVCFFTDPEGNRVELMEGWQDEAGAGG